MSIVGPRPERPTFIRDLVEEIPEYALRLRVKPGITGLAQVNQAYDTCLAGRAGEGALRPRVCPPPIRLE